MKYPGCEVCNNINAIVMIKKIVVVIVFVLLTFASRAQQYRGDPGLPKAQSRQSVVVHKAYTLEYSEVHEQPRWTAHMLTRERVQGDRKRESLFYEDTMVVTGTATAEDYRKSGYSRGHMVPAGDMKWDSVAMHESNYYSNITPQLADLNNGAWNRVENRVRQWAKMYDTLYVYTGPVLRSGLPSIGRNHVSVPEYFWKVVYCPCMGKAIAFLLPNRRCDEDIRTFVISVRKLEQLTGIDFFPRMPSKIQNHIEKTLCENCWDW